MKRAFAAIAAAVAVAGVSGCGQHVEGPSVPSLHGPNAGLVAQADCGEDGVANVHVVYGQVDENQLIGRSPITLSLGGGIESFDKRYGTDGKGDYSFTITTSPTKGTCTTTLTDDDTGDVLATKTTAGTARLEVLFKVD